MATVPIYPTTQPALVLGYLTLPIALRHLGMDCEAEAMESSPANIQAAADYAANMMETTITRNEFITIMGSIKPLLQFLFLKELARSSPEYYSELDHLVTEKILPSLANNTPLLANMMGGGEAEDFKAIQTKILEWKEHTISGDINDDILKPIETEIRKLIARFQIKYETKVSPLSFNRENPESLPDVTYMNAVTGRTNTKKETTCQTFTKSSFKNIAFTATLIAFAAIGSIVSGERFRRLRDTVSVERNTAVAKIEIQKNVCETMSSATSAAQFKQWMAGYSTCDTAFNPVTENIRINARSAINTFKANNPVFYLSDISFLGAYCDSSATSNIFYNRPTTPGTTKTATASAPGFSTGICNFPLGYPNPAVGAVAVQRYVAGVFTPNLTPTGTAITNDKSEKDEITTTVKKLVGKTEATAESAKIRFAEARREANESSKLNLNFFGTLFTAGAAIATGASTLFGATGVLGSIGRVVGIAAPVLGTAGRVVPKLTTGIPLTQSNMSNGDEKRKAELAELEHRIKVSKLQSQLNAIPQPALGRTGSSGSRRGGRMPTRRRVNRKLRNTRKRR